MSSPLAPLEDKYEIVRKMREGGMGAIYEVRHRLLGEPRVIKTLRSNLADDADLHRRFAREAKAAIHLRHPHVVQIFDFLIEEGTGYIIMEHISGVDLGELIARGERPSLALGLEIAAQSLTALAFLHRQGYVHRDISPDNLMLSRDHEGRPFVKLIDLGIAKGVEDDLELTGNEMFLGKFRYSSPEHFGSAGLSGVDLRSDLYAFGVVLYELLTGAFPIAGETDTQMIFGHLHQPPRDFAETDPDGRLPEELRKLLLRALAKDPELRFADAETFVAELDGLRANHPFDAVVQAELERLLAASVERECDTTVPFEEIAASVGSEAEGSPSTDSPSTDSPSTDSQPTVRALPPEDEESAFDQHLRVACELVGEESYQEAAEHFEAALALEPDNDTVARLLEEVQEKLDEERGASRQRSAEEEVEIEALLARGELETAAQRLASARRVYGESTAFAELDDKITVAQKGVAAVAEALEEARRAMDEGRLLEADRVIYQAREAHGDDPRLDELAVRLDTLYHQSAETSAGNDPRRRLARLVHRAGLAIEQQRLEDAEVLLAEALAVDPGNEWLVEQHQRLQLRRE